jgi:hypothetical protein
MYDITDCTREGNRNSPAVWKQTILELLFADDFAVCSFTTMSYKGN